MYLLLFVFVVMFKRGAFHSTIYQYFSTAIQNVYIDTIMNMHLQSRTIIDANADNCIFGSTYNVYITQTQTERILVNTLYRLDLY